MDYENIPKEIEKEIPFIAKDIIKNNNNLPYENKKRFLNNPDSVYEHDPKWHQWGIITHSKKFRQKYDRDVNNYLKKWGLKEKVDNYLEDKIDGIKKSELIRISMPLHDIGKFHKKLIKNNSGFGYDFKNHDKISRDIILKRNLRKNLEQKGLNKNHIEYIAKCAGNHFELGFIREKGKKSSLGYTIEFSKSKDFYDVVNSHLKYFRDFETEIGLLFLADSLSKTDVFIPGKTDKELEKNSLKAKKEINKRGLNKNLINAAKQKPVNVSVAKEYLKIVFSNK